MFGFLAFIFNLILSVFHSKKGLLIEVSLLKKEVEILKRNRQDKKVITNYGDRLLFCLLNASNSIKNRISIVQPQTVLGWQRDLIKRFWTFKISHTKKGRKPVSKEIRELILSMKNDNILWGVKRIQGELLKLAISLDPKTVWNVLQCFRRQGKIRKSLSWKKFLKMHAKSIYAIDFFTVDTLLNQRYYVLFMIAHKTREIVQFAITKNPAKEFVRQQLIEFEQRKNDWVYMISDRASQFNFCFASYHITAVKTSVKAPDMNAIAERFVASARKEALDHFILLNLRQVRNVLSEYIEYYNSKRPHQGIDQKVPQTFEPQEKGNVLKTPVLSGLHHHYFRMAA